MSLNQLLPLIPSVLHSGVKASRYYASKTNTLLIQADDSRKQTANKDTCYRKLTEMLIDIYKATIPGQTSQEQKDKVKGMQKAENETRLKHKKMQSNKKASRTRGFDD